MRVLVDTQSWLWIHLARERFSEKTRRLIRRRETDLLLSVASIWGISIKQAFSTGVTD